ncbi:MAG: alpha/beta fold hydrolase [Phycicoccus sp.]|nr:alpha/beta fold hydrolase [Phycicoccus sp.]
MSSEIRPFRIEVPEEVLADLRHRLEATRWPDRELVDDWSQGAPLAYIQDLCRTWADDYDWRTREERLNAFAQFVTEIDGVDIHLIHEVSPHPEAVPLVITHGWPGSIVEFHKVIRPLVDPVAHGGSAADAFHVIAPSLPGFGFSGKPTQVGWGVEKIADVWAELMTRLGYQTFLAQGGDWGSNVTAHLGARHPDRVAGLHVTLTTVATPSAPPVTPHEMNAVARAKKYLREESGYATQQRTRPQTLGYALTDSPSGQAAWIVEKFRAWTDCDGHPENVLTRDELLDNIMFYWATGSATSSARLYWESFGPPSDLSITVPAGFAVYPEEIVPPVRSWVDNVFSHVVHWREYPRGGHFAALEVPQVYVEDVREFARHVR